MINDLLAGALPDVDSTSFRLRRLERGRQTLRAGTLVTGSGSYAATPNNLLTSDGKLSLVSTDLSVVGAIPPIIQNSGFSYVSSDTNIHLYWDGTNSSKRLVQRRIDGTSQVLPGGDVNVTGLTASTNYYFIPYWAPDANSCTIGFVKGTAGTPQILFTSTTDTTAAEAIQQQHLLGREPLSNGMILVATTAPAAPPGGGGDLGCVMHGHTEVEPLVHDGAWHEILPETNWVRLVVANGHSLNCTHDHPVYREAHGRTQAIDVEVGDLLITQWGFLPVIQKDVFRRACLKEKWHVPNGHAMWCNGILSHNVKVRETF